jgi:hypothetical protein
MKSLQVLGGISVLALAISGCSTWDRMGQTQKGTTVGAASGAVAGAAVGGPVGAVAGAGVGGAAGHELAKESQSDRTATTSGSTATGSSYPAAASTNTGSMSTGISSNDSRRTNSTQPYVSSSNTMGSASNTTTPSSSQSSMGMNRSMSSGSADMSDPLFVRSVQQALNAKGFKAGAVDGKMGPHTEAAIRKFQNAKGLQGTGQLDSATVAALGISQPYESSTMGSAGSDTAANRSGSAGLNTTTGSSSMGNDTTASSNIGNSTASSNMRNDATASSSTGSTTR